LRGAARPAISGLSDVEERRPVTNRIALWLGLFLVLALIADTMYFGNEHLIYLGRKLSELIEWIAFWR
jgi:hypothetical protein